jgi:hypothetical protein
MKLGNPVTESMVCGEGLVCAECDRELAEGDRFSEKLEAVYDGTPVVLLVCVPCALGLADPASR